MSAFNQRLSRLYERQRGLGPIDEQVDAPTLIRFAVDKAWWRLRGIRRGFPSAYIGPDVVIRSRRRLELGPGVVIGRHVQVDALSREGVRLAASATVDSGAILRGSGGIRRVGIGIAVGQRAAIGARNFIHGGGGVTIGDDCLLGPDVKIFSENHNVGRADVPIIEQGESGAPVVIGHGAWIGAGSIVTAGVTIGAGAVVAAGSVVTRDLPSNSVAAGVPARLIRDSRLNEE